MGIISLFLHHLAAHHIRKSQMLLHVVPVPPYLFHTIFQVTVLTAGVIFTVSCLSKPFFTIIFIFEEPGQNNDLSMAAIHTSAIHGHPGHEFFAQIHLLYQ